MQTKFKRHQKVKILTSPDLEYVEYDPRYNDQDKPTITVGMIGEVNMILPNGQYHVELKDENGDTIAYVPFSEEELELLQPESS